MTADVQELATEEPISKAGDLLHSLAPRAQVFCYYDRQRQCLWSSDGADDYEIDSFVIELPEEILEQFGDEQDMLHRTLSSGRTVLALPVFADSSNCIGVLIALFSKNAGKASSFNPGMLKSILQPAVELIGENLRIGSELHNAENSLTEVENEVRLVYEVDEKIHGAAGRHSGLAELVGRSGRYVSINYTVLLIPSKRIRISATHSNWKMVKRKVLDRYLVEQLLPKLDKHRHPIVFEIPAVDGSSNAAEKGYQALLCPILDKHGSVEGVLAQLGKVDGSEFTKNDRRFMAHIGRKVEYVIDQSFDAMTGMMNRTGFESQLRESRESLTSDSDAHQIIYFDLDNLQLINDSFSHKAGDEVILNFSRLLEDDLPKTAVLSRLTGDDFCMLLTHESSETALEYANGIREKTAALRYLDGDRSVQVTISAGIAEFNRSCSDVGNALTTARMACESAKAHGRDHVVVYEAENRSVVRRYDDMQLVAEIQRALDGDEFELVAQPIVRLSGESDSPRYEILLRMNDGDGGYIPNSALFSAGERYRMMPQIDRWVISTTMAALAEQKESIELHNAVFCVNLSGQSLGGNDILEFIEEEIEQSGLPASALCFEITESAAVSNLKKAQAFIERLSRLGCLFALDDFGAGLSSFAYLKNFSVDTLKIDGGFIHDITENRISESMVAAITQVAEVMQLETVAEYVGSDEARELISKLGVDYAQGNFIGKPVALDGVLADLSDVALSSTG